MSMTIIDSPSFTPGERVVMLAQGTMQEERSGIVIVAPPNRVSYADCVWIELDRPVLGQKIVQPPLDRVRHSEELREERNSGRMHRFAPLLREFRDRLRLSQSRLAEAAGFDHSYVSRLESGTRTPTRDAVMKLAEALGLDEGERDALLASAGFMPGRIENLLASEPALSEALGLLQDRAVPAEVRDGVRQMITLLVRQAHRAVVSS